MTFPGTQKMDFRPDVSSTPSPTVHDYDQQTLHEAQVPMEGHRGARTLVPTHPLVVPYARGQAAHHCSLWMRNGRERFLEQSPSLGPQWCPLTWPTVASLPFTGAIIGTSHSSARPKRNLWKPHEGEEGREELRRPTASGSH